MSSYEFFPFVEPSNVGTIEFPNFDTLVKQEQMIVQAPKGELNKSVVKEEVPRKPDIGDLSIDFTKLKISRGRQTKTSGGYSHEQLKNFGKSLKKRGIKIDMKSKDGLIDSIMLLE